MAPKSLPPAAKQALILAHFHTTSTCYTIRELEKLLPAVASISSMQVKEHMQALVDESLVRLEKIGAGNWYWSFVSDAKVARLTTLRSLSDECAKLENSIKEIERDVEGELGKRQNDEGEGGGEERRELEGRFGELTKETEELERELGQYAQGDPIEFAKHVAEVGKLREAALKWSDYLECVEGFLVQLTGDRGQVAGIMAEACREEYVVGEGLKELAVDGL